MKRCIIVLLMATMLAAASFMASAATIIFPAVRAVSDTIPLLTDATTGTSDIVNLHHEFAVTTVWIFWNGTCSAGVVEIQAAMTPAGPWVTVPAGTTFTYKTDLPDWIVLLGSPGALRVTITTPVIGGTVSVYLTGKP